MHDLLKNRHREPGPFASGVLAGLGIILALAPVGLWVAWSLFVLAVVVATIAVSAALFIVLHDHHAPVGDPRAEAEYRSAMAVQDELVDEVHRIFPLTYHHSNRPRARFRRAMEKIRNLIE